MHVCNYIYASVVDPKTPILTQLLVSLNWFNSSSLTSRKISTGFGCNSNGTMHIIMSICGAGRFNIVFEMCSWDSCHKLKYFINLYFGILSCSSDFLSPVAKQRLINKSTHVRCRTAYDVTVMSCDVTRHCALQRNSNSNRAVNSR